MSMTRISRRHTKSIVLAHREKGGVVVSQDYSVHGGPYTARSSPSADVKSTATEIPQVSRETTNTIHQCIFNSVVGGQIGINNIADSQSVDCLAPQHPLRSGRCLEDAARSQDLASPRGGRGCHGRRRGYWIQRWVYYTTRDGER